MKKTMILLSALLLFPLSAQAHSVLESSIPAEGEVVTEPIGQIVLDFSAGIEEGSTMAMAVDGVPADFSEVAVLGDQLLGTPAEALENGSYIITYEVLSEDGHPISGEFAFELDAEAAGSNEAAEEQATEEEPAEEGAAVTGADTVSEEESVSEVQESGSSITYVIAGIAVLLLVAVLFLTRRKR